MDATRVDGNALAGMLDGLFAGDATVLVATCGACGATGALAETVVELDERCAIVLCRGCTHTLFTVVRNGDAVRLVIGAVESFTG
jgi:hypothetical protein